MNTIQDELNALATKYVGDDQKPDYFFVTDRGNVITITDSFNLAYEQWERLANRDPFQECALENRDFGVIASVEPESDGSSSLIIIDDSRMYSRS